MKNKFIAILLAVLIIAVLATTAFANATAPPGMLIYVSGAPEDMTVTLVKDGLEVYRVEREDRLWQSCFRLYYERKELHRVTVKVESSVKSFEVMLPEEIYSGYNNLLTLDFEKETLIAGEPWWRQPLLVGLRVALTLVLEGIVFWRFDYRKKWSWAVFLAVNLATQTALNIAVVGDIRFATYSWMLSYVLMEAAIFAVEAVTYGLLLKEEDRWHGVRCALAANGVSMVVGGVILSILPV